MAGGIGKEVSCKIKEVKGEIVVKWTEWTEENGIDHCQPLDEFIKRGDCMLEYLEEQMLLSAEICLDRNYISIHQMR
eukprot:Pgem_evm1s281